MKRLVAKLTMVICCMSALVAIAQTVQVAEDSRIGTPIRLSGTMSFSESRADCAVTVTNLSKKAVAKLSFVLEAVLPNGKDYVKTISHDHTSSPLAAGARMDIMECGFPYNDDDRPLTPTAPTAHLRVTFVGFSDGST